MFRSDTHVTLDRPVPPAIIRTDDETEAIDVRKGFFVTKTQVLASLAVSMGSLIVGYSSAWSSPAIASMMEPGSGIEVSFNERKKKH